MNFLTYEDFGTDIYIYIYIYIYISLIKSNNVLSQKS